MFYFHYFELSNMKMTFELILFWEYLTKVKVEKVYSVKHYLYLNEGELSVNVHKMISMDCLSELVEIIFYRILFQGIGYYCVSTI